MGICSIMMRRLLMIAVAAIVISCQYSVVSSSSNSSSNSIHLTIGNAIYFLCRMERGEEQHFILHQWLFAFS